MQRLPEKIKQIIVTKYVDRYYAFIQYENGKAIERKPSE